MSLCGMTYWELLKEVVVGAWIIGLAPMALAAVAMVQGFPLLDSEKRKRLLPSLVSFVTPAVLPLIGLRYCYSGPRGLLADVPPQAWAWLHWLPAAHLALVLAAVWWASGVRLRALAVVLLGSWFALNAWLLAGTLVTGDG
jgi:hypothetical protein